MNATKRIEAVGHASLAIMELKSALEAVEDVVPAVTRDGSIVELIAPATTDANQAVIHLLDALACANADEETSYGMAGLSPGEWEAIARFLWGLLDDIDTLDDACKDDDHAFREQARKQQKERWRVSESDGQTVRFHAKIHPPPEPSEPSEPDDCSRCGLLFCHCPKEEPDATEPASPV